MRKPDWLDRRVLGSPQRLEALLVAFALSVLLVIDTGSVWTWIVPLLVAVTLLMILRQGPRQGPRPAG